MTRVRIANRFAFAVNFNPPPGFGKLYFCVVIKHYFVDNGMLPHILNSVVYRARKMLF